MANGGARPGAGRKPARERYSGAIIKLEKQIVEKLPTILDSLLELAHGVTVKEVGPDGKEKIYTRAPDFKAASYLVDRILGKPVTAIEAEVTGEGGGAVLLAFAPNVLKAYGDSDEPSGASDEPEGAGTEGDG